MTVWSKLLILRLKNFNFIQMQFHIKYSSMHNFSHVAVKQKQNIFSPYYSMFHSHGILRVIWMTRFSFDHPFNGNDKSQINVIFQ